MQQEPILFSCSLCGCKKAAKHYNAQQRNYIQCSDCGLILMEPKSHLSFEQEGQHYLTHQNDRENLGYVSFLNQLLLPFSELLTPGANVLDYGSGPGPVAAELMRESGFVVSCYDPHFAKDQGPLSDTYQGVISTEVVEHFRNPAEEFARIDKLLQPGGYLGLMTLLFLESEDFENWWYIRDLTHCVFYQEKTLEYLSSLYSWSIVYNDRERVVIFRK